MKQLVGKLVAAVAIKVTKVNVNCTCRGWSYQAVIPKEAQKLRKTKDEHIHK